MNSWKSRGGKSQRGEGKKWEDQRRKKMQVREQVGKSRFTVFPMICGSGGSKSRLAIAAGAEPAGQMRDEELHAGVARSAFRSQNAQNKPGSDGFWKLRCRKSVGRCGAKHMSKPKCTKHTMFGLLLEVEMLKKCTPLCCEAHSQIKMYKALHVRTTFGSWDAEKVHAVVARSTFSSQKCTTHTHHSRTTFGNGDVEKVHVVVARSTCPFKCTKHTIPGPLLEVAMLKKCMLLWREAHFQVKMYKALHVRTTFGSWHVKKVYAVVARSMFFGLNFDSNSFASVPWLRRLLGTCLFWRYPFNDYVGSVRKQCG